MFDKIRRLYRSGVGSDRTISIKISGTTPTGVRAMERLGSLIVKVENSVEDMEPDYSDSLIARAKVLRGTILRREPDEVISAQEEREIDRLAKEIEENA